MRDVIVAGAGGGGAVIAKELAAQGLDVLLLEAGPRFGNLERDWSHFESDANGLFGGYFRFGPADLSRPAWLRELPQSSLFLQLSGVGGTTNHYQGNSPRAMPGAFAAYEGDDAAAYDTAHLFPFSYRELVPYYEWVEHTLPVQTAPMGAKEDAFLRGAQLLGLPVQRSKDITRAACRAQENAIIQPSGTAGKTNDPSKLQFPQAKGCTFCGHCAQGCFLPRQAPLNLKSKRATSVSYTEDAAVIVLACGTAESPRLWLNSGLPNPNGWVGAGLTDHFVDLVVGVMPFYTGLTKGSGSGARIDYPGYGMIEVVGQPPGTTAGLSAFSDAGIAGFYDNGLPDASGADTVGRLIGKPRHALKQHSPR